MEHTVAVEDALSSSSRGLTLFNTMRSAIARSGKSMKEIFQILVICVNRCVTEMNTTLMTRSPI